MSKGDFLSTDIKEEFLISNYFNLSNGFEIAGIRRAYLDFNRTLVLKDKSQFYRDKIRFETESYLKKRLLEIISLEFKDQVEFDRVHKELCYGLLGLWSELSIGKAQKWINMTLKYWLIFGENRIANIEKNAIFFHIPIDNFVQVKMFNEKNPKPWSKITSYDEYMKYQHDHRNKKTNNPPILDEFVFFNNIKTHKTF